MPEFIIKNATATLTKVDTRKRKRKDKRILHAFLYFETEALNDDLGCFNLEGQSVKDHFWDEEGRPRFPEIAGLTFKQVFEHHCITIGAQEYSNATISRVCINPLAGDVAGLSFTVELEPSKQQTGMLCDLAEEKIEISIQALQGDLLEEAMKQDDDEPDGD